MSVIPFPSQTTADRANDQALKAPIDTAIAQLQAEAVRLRQIAVQLSAALSADQRPIENKGGFDGLIATLSVRRPPEGSREAGVRFVVDRIRLQVRQIEGAIETLAASRSRPTVRQIERRNIRFGRGVLLLWEKNSDHQGNEMLRIACEAHGVEYDDDESWQREIVLQDIGFQKDSADDWHFLNPPADVLDQIEIGLKELGFKWIERQNTQETRRRAFEVVRSY